MPLIINEEKMLEENLFKYEDRVKSSLVRYSDKTFTPVEYYHINNNQTTVDAGWNDVEEILGERSPIRFQVIHNFPLYISDAINPDLSESEIGLDSTYEGEATILPGTLVPLQNDYFIIKQLHDSYVFRITEVQGDAIMPDNYYKINFMLEYVDKEKQDELDKQTTDKFTCIIENIGTEDRCIIEDDYCDDVRKINTMYNEMLNNYITFFYSSKYNSLLGDLDGDRKIFDPLQREFIQKHQLFIMDNQIDNLVLTEQFRDPKRKIKYENSIYRFIETRDLDKLSKFPYYTFLGMNNKQTSFARWHDTSVYILDINSTMDPETPTLLSQDSENVIRMNYPTNSKYLQFISNYVHRDNLSLQEIDLTLGDELLVLQDSNLEVFFFTPIIMYIIRDIVSSFMKRKKEN